MPGDPNATHIRDNSRPPVSPTPPAGGRYVLGEEIARGGMGAVFRATDTVLGRQVAVKVLQEAFNPHGDTARRFADEARIAAQLQHPGIPPVHDLGFLPAGRPFLAMKLIKGDTLDRLLARRPDPGADRGRFVAAFEAVCQAVAYAHARGVVHRDLKPANVMVGAFGEVQVMDWGLAKVLPGREGPTAADAVAPPGPAATIVQGRPDQDDLMTRAGAVLGTPAYMAPEQAVGAVAEIDARSDVFGLGGILAAVLTGLPPFRGDAAEGTQVKAARGEVGPCFARLDGCGAEPELVALCKRCLSPARADRPADAGAVATAVAAFRLAAEARARQAELDRVKAEGERATAEAQAAEQQKRRRVQLGLAAAVVVLAAGAGGVAVWRADEDGRARAAAVQRAAEDDRRGQAEQERVARAADAVADLLDRAKAALADGDASRAAPLLDQASRRAADGVTEHAARRDAYARDLDMLRTLDGVNDFRWTAADARSRPSPEQVAGRWAAAFAGYGLAPGTTPPAEAAARVADSPIRPALVAALDGWLARSRSAAVRDLLAAADPDPFRDEVRGRLAAGDGTGLAALGGRAEWAVQPSGLVQAYGASRAVPPEVARALLLRLAVARRTDFGLLMQLGATNPGHSVEAAGDRARWFQAAVALRPGNPTALNGLGLALHDAGDADGAIAAYREAARLDPHFALPHNNVGNALRAKGDLDGAAAAYHEAIRLDPKYALPHLNLGNLLAIRHDPEGAIAAYRKAIRLDPKDARPHNNLGNVLRARGDQDGAIAAYREAISLDPKSALSHDHLAVALRAKGDLDGAIAAYREAIKLDPKDARPHNNLGTLLRTKGDLDGAVAAYHEAIRLDPKYALPHENLGNVLAARHDPDGAITAYRDAVRLDPGLTAAHVSLGHVYRRLGRYDEAIAAYRAALAIQPDLGPARAGLDFCLRVRGSSVPTAPAPRPVRR
ncbi:MAG TPA: serine/threonine-protein kinase [Urbifossiella sp.]|jgi:tetratricopeptide (TPR) repeat protein|nr:serine/threonine-protein kinase [Urbifossiella sp.]